MIRLDEVLDEHRVNKAFVPPLPLKAVEVFKVSTNDVVPNEFICVRKYFAKLGDIGFDKWNDDGFVELRSNSTESNLASFNIPFEIEANTFGLKFL